MDLVGQLNDLVASAPHRKLKTIYEKYSHKNFYEVILMTTLFISIIEKIIKVAKNLQIIRISP